MVYFLFFLVLLVPIMRVKDTLNSSGIGLHGLYLKAKSFNLASLSKLSWSQVWVYLKGFVKESNSCVGFEKFEVEDSQNQSTSHTLIEEVLGIVWESY